MDKKLASQCGQSILGEYFKELDVFFSQTKKLSGEYDYIIFNSRRVEALNKAFESVENSHIKNAIHKDGISYIIDDIVHLYHSKGTFPHILIIDDLLLYGRSLNFTITYLIKQLYEYIEKPYKIEGAEDYYNFQRRILSYIDIIILKTSKKSCLMDGIYLDKVRNKSNLSVAEIRELYRKTYNFLDRLKINSKNNLLTHKLDEPPKKSDWIRRDWDYSIFEYNFYYKDQYKNMMPTIRVERIKKELVHQYFTEELMLTSQVIFGKMSISDFNNLCNQVADIIKLEFWTDILKDYNPMMKSSKGHIISFLLSLVNTVFFMGDKFNFEKTNINDIANFFGNKSGFVDEIKKLVDDKTKLCLLNEVLEKEIVRSSDSIISNISCKNMDEINHNIEDTLWNEIVESYSVGEKLLKSNRPIMSEKEKGYADIANFISTSSRNSNSIEYIFSLLIFYDHYYLDFKYDPNPEIFEMCIKADKQAASIMPKRLNSFLEALITVEKQAWRVNKKPLEALRSFLIFLKTCSSEITSKEMDEYLFLINHGTSIIDDLKDTNQTFSSWGLSQTTTEELMIKYGKQYFKGALEELEISNKHLELAQKYLKY